MERTIIQLNRTLILLAIFCIAMGVLEAIVVVYLRRVYYPSGFDFPLKFLSPEMLLTEWIREIATMIMLVVIGILAGKDNVQRFLYFLFCFAIWDITYYVGLKAFLYWPASLLVWDILFLIPVPWISPVLAPLVCSVTMLFFAVSILFLKNRISTLVIKPLEWGLILLGALLIFISFIYDYLMLIFESGLSISENEKLWSLVSGFIPVYFNWLLFGTGEFIIVSGIILVITRTILKNKSNRI